MSLGFHLNVDSSEVRLAKRETSALRDAIKDLRRDGDDIPIGVNDSGLAHGSEILKSITSQINQLKGLAKNGEGQGGLLRVGQFRQVSALSKDIRENFEAYHKAIASSENQLDRLISKRRELSRIRDKAPTKFYRERAEGEIKKVDGQIDKLTRELDKRFARETELARQSGIASDRLSGMRQESQMPGRGLWKRAFGYGAALVGGVSLLRFLQNSASTGMTFADTETDLTMRGVTGLRRKHTYGYSPSQNMAITAELNREMGINGRGLTTAVEATKLFSRATGTQAQFTSGFLGGIYQSTALSGKGAEKELTKIYGALKNSGAANGRVEVFLNQLRSTMADVSRGRGGAPLTSREINEVLGLQTSLWHQGLIGQSAAGSGLISELNSGIRGGGHNLAQEMFLMNSIGGPHMGGAADYYRYLRLKSQGIYGVGPHGKLNIERIMEHSVNRFGTEKDGRLSYVGRMNLMSMFGLTTSQADLLSKMFQQGDFRKKPQEASRDLRREMSHAAGRSQETLGGRVREVNVGINELQLKISQGLLPSIVAFKEGLLKASKDMEGGHLVRAIRDALHDNPIGQIALTAGVVNIGGKLLSKAGDGPSSFLGGALGGAAFRRATSMTAQIAKGSGVEAGTATGGATATEIATATETGGAGSLALIPGLGLVLLGAAGITAAAKKSSDLRYHSMMEKELLRDARRHQVMGIGGGRFGGGRAEGELYRRLTREEKGHPNHGPMKVDQGSSREAGVGGLPKGVNASPSPGTETRRSKEEERRVPVDVVVGLSPDARRLLQLLEVRGTDR